MKEYEVFFNSSKGVKGNKCQRKRFLMRTKYAVCVDTGETGSDGRTMYGYLEHRGKSEWLTKRTAQKHADDYKATHLRDAWVEEF